jgi:TPR repeat protein
MNPICFRFIVILSLFFSGIASAQDPSLLNDAKKGDASAQYKLGLAYERGEGAPIEYTKALKWYRLAADQGHAPSQVNIGLLHERGQVGPINYTEALKWYHLAAAQKNVLAQLCIANLYANGLGVPTDDAEAAKWFRLAADQKVPLGKMKRTVAPLRKAGYLSLPLSD